MDQPVARVLTGVLLSCFAIGCGTIIHGTGQDITIASSPDTAEVWIDTVRMGNTPLELELKRKNEYLVTVKKPWYREVTVKIERSTSGWIFGNILFGGIIGIAVDIITGGGYQLDPERLDLTLNQIAEFDGETIPIESAQLENLRELRLLDEFGHPEIVVSLKWAD